MTYGSVARSLGALGIFVLGVTLLAVRGWFGLPFGLLFGFALVFCALLAGAAALGWTTWQAAGIVPHSLGQREETGQGMGATLNVADQRRDDGRGHRYAG